MSLLVNTKYWFALYLLSCVAIYSPSICASETIKIGRAHSLSPTAATELRTNLVIKAANTLGVDISFVDLPATRSLKLVSEGILDAEIGRHNIIEPSFPELIRVDEPIGYLDYWVWILADEQCLTDRKDLKMLKPVGVRGILFYDQLIYPNSEAGYEKVNNLSQLFSMVIKRRADYLVHSKQLMLKHTHDQHIDFKSCFEHPLFTLNFYLYLNPSKKHLKVPFEVALRKIKYGY